MNYKYKSLAEFKRDYPSEYSFLKGKKLLKNLCQDMGWVFREKKIDLIKPNGYWAIKENVIAEAIKYSDKASWSSNSSGSIKSAYKNGWIEECTAHMEIKLLTPKTYWSLENCIEEAKKYETRTEWNKKSYTSYKIARKNNWMNICTIHMVELQKPDGFWTLERCLEESKKYKTVSEWKNNDKRSYQAAMTGKFLDKCTSHMEVLRLPRNYWTKEKCIDIAKNYNGRFEWQKNNFSSYNTARINGWLDECCVHMVKK
jgi:hypothetical protein